MPRKAAKTPSSRSRSDAPVAIWLRTLRAANNMDQAEFGQHIGTGRSTIANYESGQRPITAKILADIRAAFPDAPTPPTIGDVEITGSAFADEKLYGKIRYAGEVPCSGEWGDPLESTELVPIDPKFTGRKRFIARVKGRSCWPFLRPGDMTVWQVDDEPDFGLIVIAERFEDSGCTVKLLEEGPTPNTPILTPLNPDSESPEDGEGWKATARLIGVLRKPNGPEWSVYWPDGLRPKHLPTEIF